MPYRKGGRNREKLSNPAYKPPLHFILRLRLQKGGRICGTLRYYQQNFALQTLKLEISHHASMCFVKYNLLRVCNSRLGSVEPAEIVDVTSLLLNKQ